MRNKELNFTVDEDRALAILKSPDQLIILKDEQGNWNGDAINKSEIIGTKLDKERTKDEERKNQLKLEGRAEEEKSPEEIKALLNKYRPQRFNPIDKDDDIV